MQNRVYEQLNQEKALIWRIIHKENFAWTLANGLHSGNSAVKHDSWVHIGSSELIDKRSRLQVPVGKQGVLNDYVPFYFTPFSPMLYNIRTGYGGIQQHKPEDIIILVSDLQRIAALSLDYVFTDMHAYYRFASFYTDPKNLDKIDWEILQHRDFKRDPNDPQKIERYQAEALVYQHCPAEALLGVICYNDDIKQELELLLAQSQCNLQVVARPSWYF